MSLAEVGVEYLEALGAQPNCAVPKMALTQETREPWPWWVCAMQGE